MSKKKSQILILEDDAYFRNLLGGICSELGEVTALWDLDSALGVLTQKSFQLLLLDWHLIQPGPTSLYTVIDNFQPSSFRMALFTVPDLSHVIAAMKSGVGDILWASQDQETIKEKIEEGLSMVKTPGIAHSFVSQLAESLTDKAITQKTSLFRARKEFSRTFLHQILNQQKMRRDQLASLMNVSPRTLHRHLSA